MQLLIAVAVFGVLCVSVLVVIAAPQGDGAHEAHASAMTIGMTLGMVSGLTIGMVAGLVMPDDMLLPTAVGAVCGGVSGWAGGRYGGLAAILEGMMSGLMAGAMGAMMGGMMPARGVPLLLTALVITAGAGAASLALLRPQGHSGHPGHHQPAWLTPKQVLASAAVALIGGFGAWFVAGPLVHRLPLPDEHRHISAVEVTVKATEFGFAPAVVEVPLGRPIKLHLMNEGLQEHDLTVPGMEYRLSASRDRRAEPPGLHLFAASGRTESLEIIPLRAGQYQAYCSVAGHKEQGMTITLTVVNPDAGGSDR